MSSTLLKILQFYLIKCIIQKLPNSLPGQMPNPGSQATSPRKYPRLFCRFTSKSWSSKFLERTRLKPLYNFVKYVFLEMEEAHFQEHLQGILFLRDCLSLFLTSFHANKVHISLIISNNSNDDVSDITRRMKNPVKVIYCTLPCNYVMLE